MVQCSYTIFIKEWFPMWETLMEELANVGVCVSYESKVRVKFFNAAVMLAMLFGLHTLALTNVQLQDITVLQLKMLRSNCW